jgi:beta-lactamase class A
MKLSVKNITVSFLLILISFTSGFFLSEFLNVGTISSTTKETRKKFNYKFINPLLECDNNNISQDKNLTSLRKSIDFIINQEVNNNKISFASIYYRDLNNGPWMEINADALFSPASLVKVPVMIAYFKAAENDRSILEKKIVNTQDFDYSQQNITPTQIIKKGQEYSVEELIKKMIIYSDNGAYELLLNNIDDMKIYQVYLDLDVDISKAQQDPNGNIISVRDYASFFRILYNASYLSQDMSEKALDLLSQSQFYNGLVAGTPSGIVVAHKFGERQFLPSQEKQFHDCGIIYAPNKPYLLCVMSRSDNFDNAINFIKEVSKTVYNEITKDSNPQ